MISKYSTIKGTVLAGQNKGDETGARTANLALELAKGLKKGLYSCDVLLNKKNYDGLLFYGHNSLSKKNCLEIHILNFNKDIYGKKLEIIIKKFLRPPKKFKKIENLRKQIEHDINSTAKN